MINIKQVTALLKKAIINIPVQGYLMQMPLPPEKKAKQAEYSSNTIETASLTV